MKEASKRVGGKKYHTAFFLYHKHQWMLSSVPRLMSTCVLHPWEQAVCLPWEQPVFGMNCMFRWESLLQVIACYFLASEVETNYLLAALKLLLNTQCTTSQCLVAPAYTDFTVDHPQNKGISEGVPSLSCSLYPSSIMS